MAALQILAMAVAMSAVYALPSGRRTAFGADADLCNQTPGATQTAPIIYRDGDSITQAGQTLQMHDGRWVPLARGEDSASMTDLVGKLANPYAAFEAGITWADAHQCVTHMQATSQSLVSGFMNLRQHRMQQDS